MRKVTLACGTTYTFEQIEDVGISYVPCTHTQPIFPYAHLWNTERQITRKSYGKQFNTWKLSGMKGLQLMTGKPSYRSANGSREYLVDVDIEDRLLEKYPDHAERITSIYRNACEGEPCIIRTKSDGRRLSGFSAWYDSKMSFTDPAADAADKSMLLEFFSLRGLSRIDSRYALLEGSLLAIPSVPKETYREIHAIISEIGIEESPETRTRHVIESEQISGLDIQWDSNGKSQSFPSEYCQATSHSSNRDTVVFFKNTDGSIVGSCINCRGSWYEVAPTKPHPIPLLDEVLKQDAEAIQTAIKQAPIFEDRHKQSFKHFTPEERTVIREVLQETPDAGWILTGNKNIPAWITKYERLHNLIGEFALNGQPAEVEKRRVWHSQFTQCDKCGGIAAKWIDRYLLTAGTYCDPCHKDTVQGSYLDYELNRKLPNSIISTNDAQFLGDDADFADFRLWEPGTLTYLGAAMGTGKSTEIYKQMRSLADQGIGKGIIAVPRISLARFLAHYLRRRDGYNAWGLWHEGVPRGDKFIGTAGAICCVPSLPSVLAEAEGAKVYIAIDEIDFAYNLLSLTITQASRVKQILRHALQEKGLVVAGQTESTLALEFFAAEIEAEQVQGFYKNATPGDNDVTVYKYPDVKGKTDIVVAGAEAAITDALFEDKNVYAFCATRRDAEIITEHFKELNPVLYDAYSKGTQRADVLLINQQLTDSRLFVATGAAGIGISILDEQACTVQVSSLLFGSRNCNDIVQQTVRDRGRCGGSIHLTDYQFRLPVKPSTNTRVSLYREVLKMAEDTNVHLPEHSIRKIAAAEALSTLADTQPETFLKYHLGDVAQMPIIFVEGDVANESQTERIKTTRSTLRADERNQKIQDAISLLESEAVLSSEIIRRESNAGQLLKFQRLAQETANIALQAVGWDEEEAPNVELVKMAKLLVEACIPIENLEKQRRGFYAVQFPQWTASQLDKERLFAYREMVSESVGIELTAIPDDRFIGELLRALFDNLAGVPWTQAGFADAVREVLQSRVMDHEGCRGRTFLANLLSGAAGRTLYRTSRFLNLTDNAGVCRWASQLIREWYPARIAKRGEAYGLQMHEHYNLIVRCFKSWGTQFIGKPPDRWDVNEYATVELPDPNAEAKEMAREMRKDGKGLSEIAEAVGFRLETVGKWCRGINKNAQKIIAAKALEKQGMPRKEIANELGTNTKFLTRHLGTKSPKRDKISAGDPI